MHGANCQGAKFNGNQNFQSDNNDQTFQSGLSNDTEELFEKVLEEIKSAIQDPDEQQDNIDDLNKVKEAAVSGNSMNNTYKVLRSKCRILCCSNILGTGICCLSFI